VDTYKNEKTNYNLKSVNLKKMFYTKVYAIKVPIDIISTKTSSDIMNATNAVKPPKIRVALSGVFVKLEICDNSLNTNPSFAIAMQRKI
jgi:hypothetical protein